MKTLVSVALLISLHLSLGRGTAGAQTAYEIIHDTLSATGWFGGDNRTGGSRSVGVGQSVRINSNIILNSFSFYFTTKFDLFATPTGTGHEVTLKLNIRDSSGGILQTNQVIVPASFTGGWVTWSNINMSVNANSLLIFTTYLVGAYDINQYTSSHGSDQYVLYTPGVRYAKDGTSDSDMELWVDWIMHSWDSMFWLVGTTVPVAVEDERSLLLEGFSLRQNYPNPFNPTTRIRFEVGGSRFVTLKVYDVLGREVATLVNENLDAGNYERTFYAEGGSASGGYATGLASGVYFYRLHSGSFVETKRMLLLK